jgi:hypothetical protein
MKIQPTVSVFGGAVEDSRNPECDSTRAQCKIGTLKREVRCCPCSAGSKTQNEGPGPGVPDNLRVIGATIVVWLRMHADLRAI